jgi:hypothetical protein
MIMLTFSFMEKKQESMNLEQLLDKIDEAVQENEQVSWQTVLEVLGHTSFGPLLFIAGLLTLAPVVGDIPGVPTIIGITVLLIAVQLLIGRTHLWLPHWLLEKSVASKKMAKALSWSRSPARFVDYLLRPRLSIFVKDAALYIIASLCIIVALMMPAMEVVPFSANAAGLVFTTFGLSLITRDGLMSLLGLIFTIFTIAVVVYNFV